MKKILVKSRHERAEYFCDKHLDRECYTELRIHSWYGSQHDTDELILHLCDECLEKMYSSIKKNFNIEPKEMALFR